MSLWIKRHNEENSLEHRPRSGRPRSLSIIDEDHLERRVNEDPFQNCVVLRDSLALPASRFTIRRCLKRRSLFCHRAARKVAMTEDHMRLRLQFANREIRNGRDWQAVVYRSRNQLGYLLKIFIFTVCEQKRFLFSVDVCRNKRWRENLNSNNSRSTRNCSLFCFRFIKYFKQKLSQGLLTVEKSFRSGNTGNRVFIFSVMVITGKFFLEIMVMVFTGKYQ